MHALNYFDECVLSHYLDEHATRGLLLCAGLQALELPREPGLVGPPGPPGQIAQEDVAEPPSVGV